MLKIILTLATLFSVQAFAAYPDGYCGPNETKLIFENLITINTRVQISNPKLCANGYYYSLLAGDEYDDYTSSLCGLYQMGSTVNAGRRIVGTEWLAAFDSDGKFNGVIEYKTSTDQTYRAVASITCETGP